jgi:phosphoribosylglycinamide formyltransferase 1
MSTKKYHIAILASGSGTNAEEIFKHFKDHPQIEVSLLLSNNPEAYALVRAANFNVPTLVFSRPEFKEGTTIMRELEAKKITHIVLAGFLWLIPDYLIQRFPNRIINIHPALLPKYGGKGMYGMKVHEAIKSFGEVETGISIHEVNEHYDEGKIIFQATCPVTAEDTSETIAKKVHALEYAHYARVIEKWMLASAS